MDFSEVIQFLVILLFVLGPLIFKKSQARAAAKPRPQQRPQQPGPRPRRDPASSGRSPGEDLLRRLEEEFLGRPSARTPEASPSPPPRPEPPRPQREPAPAPRRAPAGSRAAPTSRPASPTVAALRLLDAPKLRRLRAEADARDEALPPRRKRRSASRRQRRDDARATGSARSRPATSALATLREGGSAALRAAILHRILLESPPGLRPPTDALPELPTSPLDRGR